MNKEASKFFDKELNTKLARAKRVNRRSEKKLDALIKNRSKALAEFREQYQLKIDAAIRASDSSSKTIKKLDKAKQKKWNGFVYKKVLAKRNECHGSVILKMRIPDDAQVRLTSYKCRASKLEIVVALSCATGKPLKQKTFYSMYGRNLGAPYYSYGPLKYVYRVGRIEKVKNFNASHSQCATGLHFFLTMEEALQW